MAFLVLCCISAPTTVGATKAESKPAEEKAAAASSSHGFSLGTPKVDFAAGSFPEDAAELTLVLADGETALLDRFSGLTRADLSGSTCYEEIAAWAAAHPDVAVTYTVTLPNGTTVDNHAEAVDLTGLGSGDVNEAVRLLGFLPALKTADLGEPQVGADGITALKTALPQVAFSYDVMLLGQKLDPAAEVLDLNALTPADLDAAVVAVAGMPNLKKILLSDDTGLSLDNALALGDAAPQAVLSFPVSMYGKDFNLADDGLDLNHIAISDQGGGVRKILPYMRACTYLDMDSCGVSNEDMAVIRDENPNVEVIWRVNFGTDYSVRTNVTKILASKPTKGGILYNDVGEQLKYCTNVHYLDLGHNSDITDFSFISYMPELEIVVISMTGITDLTPFTNCPHLKYLEAGNTPLSDLSPLAQCKELKHLNVGTCFNVTDISPLYELDMKRLWLGKGDPVPAEQVAKMQELHPKCEVNTTVPTGLERDADGNQFNEGYVLGNWKCFQQWLTADWNFYSANGYFPAQRPIGYYKVVFKCFDYNLVDGAYAFSWNDPKFNAHDPDVKPVNVVLRNLDLLSEDWEIPESDIVPNKLEDPPGEIIWEGTH
ncbi:MAG: hypothetical protein J5927_00485 [Oscillospiraceae bacterium]|nr:hypothetical protein [Oscillospiraceae bacterium]